MTPDWPGSYPATGDVSATKEKRLMAQRDSLNHSLEDFVQGYFQDLKQDLQQVKERLEELQRKLANRVEGISTEPYLQELSRRSEAVTEREAIFSKIAVALRDLAAAQDEKGVLDTLIRHGEEIAARVLVLVRRGEHWVRFRQGELDEESTFPVDEQTVYQQAVEKRALVADQSANFPAHRGIHDVLGGNAVYCAAVPLIFGEGVPAVVYADASDTQHLDVAGLEILCQGARLAIRALHAAQPVAEVPEPRRPIEVPEAPGPAAPMPLGSRNAAAAAEQAADYRIDFSRDISPARGEFDLAEQSLREAMDASSAFRTLQERHTPPPVAEPPVSALPPVPRETEESAAPTLTEEEERQHADARRFARLLVSELKLYSEQAVVEGRRRRDIYSRLRQDIDRSREMYSRRVPANVTRRVDYFHEEMVKLLAEGDASSLGADYPGSQAATE